MSDERREATLFDNGVFTEINNLSKLVQALLNASIDWMLDRKGLRAVLGSIRPAQPGT